MKYIVRLGVALITFCLGVVVAWFATPASPKLTLEIKSPPKISPPAHETPSAIASEPVTIVFNRSYKNSHGLIIAEFKVINISGEPIDYAGDSSTPNWNRYLVVRRLTELVESDRTCGTGLLGYSLSPDQSVRFEVVAGDKPGRLQVGFDFFAGKNGLSKTVWSDEVYLRDE